MSLSLDSRSNNDITTDTVLLASTATIYKLGSQRVSASEHLQTSQVPKCACSRPTPHSAYFRKGFGSQLGDRAHYWLSVSCPVSSHQSKAMEDCTLTGKLCVGDAASMWLGSEKEDQRTSCFAFRCHCQPSLFFPLLTCLVLYLCSCGINNRDETQQILGSLVEYRIPQEPPSRLLKKIPRWQNLNHT